MSSHIPRRFFMNIRKYIDHFPASLPKPHKKSCKFEICSFFAEREGFEPPVPLGTAVFKTAVIDHSTTFPIRLLLALQPFISQLRCKGRDYF